MSISFFGAHVNNLKLVAPPGDVLSFIPNAVSLYCPFPRAFPFHDTAAHVGSKDDDELLPTSEPTCSPPVIVES